MKDKIKVEISVTPEQLKKMMVSGIKEEVEVKPYDETLPEGMQDWQ